MSQGAGRAEYQRVPYAADFISRCARAVVDARRGDLPDLSRCLILLPNLALATPLRGALARAAGGAVLLPQLLTVGQLAQPHAIAGGVEPGSVREFRLYRALREREWLPQSSLWQIGAELLQLFDELTERAVGLPSTEEQLLSRLEQAYAAPATAALHFEAQLVHHLWRAESTGRPAGPGAHALALAAAADAASIPLFALCEGEPTVAEAAFFETWATKQPVLAFVPVRRAAADPLAGFLNLAWPPVATEEVEPLAIRAAQAQAAVAASPLQGRLRLLACSSLEEEAATVAETVRDWVAAGKRTIAIVAADRTAARRARALLERDGILMRDETGWKLSTTRAAALVDAWLECLTADAWHRDLLDLLKSPFALADWSGNDRQAAVLQLESGLARHDLACGLRRAEAVLGRDPACPDAARALRRVREGFSRMPLDPAPADRWIERLEAALEALGATAALGDDAAGRVLLDLLQARRAELAGAGIRLDFGEWRAWLGREFERETFVDAGIDSPVVVTHLAATRLRLFEAAVLIGADREHLAAAAPQAVFINQAVRAELGLATVAEATARLRDDLAFLLVSSGEVAVTWQVLRNGEANPLGAEFALLALLQRLAFGDDPVQAAPRRPATGVPAGGGTPRPGPVVPRAQIPLLLSVSAFASLLACPYQFFARHVLGLAEPDEVREAVEKRDYGEVVHRILLRFHEACLRAPPTDAGALLDAIGEEAFAPLVAANFLDHAWRARWRAHAPAYLDWQKSREQEGWRFVTGEAKRVRRFRLDDGADLCLNGRLDRVDHRGDVESVLDYKVQTLAALRKRLAAEGEDVQLAAYVLLQGERVVEAAYVGLDDEQPGEVPLAEARDAAARQAERLVALFSALRAGASLPAHGAAPVCERCEARGLCRRDYHEIQAGSS